MGWEAMGCHCSEHGECEAYEDRHGVIQCAECRKDAERAKKDRKNERARAARRAKKAQG